MGSDDPNYLLEETNNEDAFEKGFITGNCGNHGFNYLVDIYTG